MKTSTIIAKLLPIKGEIKAGSRVMHKECNSFYCSIKSINDGAATIDTFEEEEYPTEDMTSVVMCAVETDFKAPIKVTALKTHAFAKFGQEYKLKEERPRGKDNSVVIVKGFEEVGDHFKKAKADDLRKPLWMKKEVFGLNLGELSPKAKWVTDGMSINIKTKKSLLGSVEPKLNAADKITVMCDQCSAYH